MPCKREDIIAKWTMALHEELHADVLHFVDGAPVALRRAGWDTFVSWMLKSLREAQWFPDFEHVAAQCALKSLREIVYFFGCKSRHTGVRLRADLT